MWVIPWVMLVDVTEPCCGHGSEVVVNLHSNLKCMHSTRYSMELHCPGAQVFTEHWTKKYEKVLFFFYRKYYIAYGWGCAASTALHYIIQCIAHCMAMSQLLHYIAHCDVTAHRLGARVFTREQLEADQPLPAIHAHASPFFSRYHGGKHDQIKIKSSLVQKCIRW